MKVDTSVAVAVLARTKRTRSFDPTLPEFAMPSKKQSNHTPNVCRQELRSKIRSPAVEDDVAAAAGAAGAAAGAVVVFGVGRCVM